MRANQLEQHKDIDKGDWKFVNIDAESGDFVIPKGSQNIFNPNSSLTITPT